MMTTHQMVEPLVLSSKDSPISAESPQLLSPEDAGYCGTMKSDDSGIVMGGYGWLMISYSTLDLLPLWPSG